MTSNATAAHNHHTWTEGKYLLFCNEGRPRGRKTNEYYVCSKQPNREPGVVLGRIAWWPAWRKYCFFPGYDVLFDPTCLREIADFVQQETTEHLKETRGGNGNS